jgi:uncharacterized Zn-finger protein
MLQQPGRCWQVPFSSIQTREISLLDAWLTVSLDRFKKNGAVRRRWVPAARAGLRHYGDATAPGARITVFAIPLCVHAMSHTATAPANAEKRYTFHRADLPLSCPTPEMALWNSHPRVYLPIEDEPNGEAKCPYCGAVFVLAD